ncbi:MAG TPA: hypothetical protein VKV17_16345 [Bryobacteraceae bacterium]|nr:hypothetical protein [Bryobacteraceae bacterium]
MRILLLVLSAACLAEAQIGYPGGPLPGQYPYPGGGYPYPGRAPYPGTGVPVPGSGGRRTPTGTAEQPLASFHGKLKTLDAKSLSLEMDDYRVVEFRLTSKTKYFKKGEEIKKPDFQQGDQISVEGNEDNTGHLVAANVYWERAGAADSADKDNKQGSEQNGAVPDTWKDKPVESGTENAPPPAPRDPDDPGPPTLKRGKPATVSAAPPPPLPADPAQTNSSGTPKAKAAQPQSQQPKQVASNLPPGSVPSLPPNPVPLPPGQVDLPPSGTGVQQRPQAQAGSQPNLVELPNEGTISRPRPRPAPDGPPAGDDSADDRLPGFNRQMDPLIRKATEAALQFTETLPNYVCQEVVSRYESETSPASWHAQDVVTTDLVYDQGKENYRNIMVNGKPPTKPLEDTGAWSTGEFGTMLIDLFSPATDAEFHFLRDGRTSGVDAKIYNFSVRRENSHWDIHFGSQAYTPAYEGSTWIDPKTGRVLRIEMEAKGLPSGFPSDHVESATDYAYIRLGDTQQYLLPTHSEILSCQRGTNYCSRNSIDFRNYHKYTGESSIQFGDAK